MNLIHGDCIEKMAELPDNSVDSIVTDPPYELGFMGKHWDGTGIAYNVETWRQALRVLKPGGHLLAFSGSRTYHRMVCAIEDAGFEIRDQIMWLYGSGFPKSHDAAQSIEKLLTTGKARRPDRDLGGLSRNRFSGDIEGGLIASTGGRVDLTTPEARQWQGWGTALKPAHEPIVLARKPLEGAVAANVLKHGTGALNIDQCRVAADLGDPNVRHNQVNVSSDARLHGGGIVSQTRPRGPQQIALGRWPANVIHDGSDEVVGAFPETEATFRKGPVRCAPNGSIGTFETKARVTRRAGPDYGGSAARFFYQAKCSKRDRNAGLGDEKNTHPTLKPTDLMRYLCRLVTPPGGTVLDPFMGSGSTGRGAVLEGFGFIGIEREADYLEIAKRRIAEAVPKSMEPLEPDLFSLQAAE